MKSKYKITVLLVFLLLPLEIHVFFPINTVRVELADYVDMTVMCRVPFFAVCCFAPCAVLCRVPFCACAAFCLCHFCALCHLVRAILGCAI
jgi:hypothetical protein